MRLIDADDFFARMENDTDLCAEMETDGLKALKKYLDMQQTAYDIDMTIDEVIAKYKEITSTDSICPGHCNISCDKCMQESKQIVEWLEELVMLRLDSCMIHMPERLRLVETGYNKAIDDFADKIISLCDDGEFMNRFNEFTATTILEMAEKLKAGEKE